MSLSQRRASTPKTRSRTKVLSVAERRVYQREQAQLHGLSPVGDVPSRSERRPPPAAERAPTTLRPALAQALKRMGLTWPTTTKQVNAKFGRLSLEKHPDQGGTNQQMRQLLQDRRLILSALAA